MAKSYSASSYHSYNNKPSFYDKPFWSNDEIHAYAKQQHDAYFNKFGYSPYDGTTPNDKLMKFTDDTYDTTKVLCTNTHEKLLNMFSGSKFSNSDRKDIHNFMNYIHNTYNDLGSGNHKAIQRNLTKMGTVLTKHLSSVPVGMKTQMLEDTQHIAKSYVKHATTPRLHHISSRLVKNGTIGHLVATEMNSLHSKAKSINIIQDYSDKHVMHNRQRIHDCNRILCNVMQYNVDGLQTDVDNYFKHSYHEGTKYQRELGNLQTLIHPKVGDEDRQHIDWQSVRNQANPLRDVVSSNIKTSWDKFYSHAHDIDLQNKAKKTLSSFHKQFGKINKLSHRNSFSSKIDTSHNHKVNKLRTPSHKHNRNISREINNNRGIQR